MPDRMTVAAPVSEVLPTSLTGRVGAGEVAGERQDDAASTMPMSTATDGDQPRVAGERGSRRRSRRSARRRADGR